VLFQGGERQGGEFDNSHPFSLVSTTQELLGGNSSGSGLENRKYDRSDLSRLPRGTLYPAKVGTNFARSV
jgi:hypothetical protein